VPLRRRARRPLSDGAALCGLEEPNTEQFLAPQFDADGRSVAHALYARLYRAAYTGIKQANPKALVAIGETSSHGRDRPSRGSVQDSHSPARFARLLSEQRPRLRFDAWGHIRTR
jgi:hypothetical protein